MLILTRKFGQKIIINSDITITVVEIDRGRVKLGFTAPESVPILRSELLDKEDRREP